MPSLVQDHLERIRLELEPLRSGAVADYIPELSQVDPEVFGLCVSTYDGHVYESGDSQVPFTIQSVSKPFTYALALLDNGPEAVAGKIDVEPSGEAFNEISLDPVTELPRNPMINAGAITAASLVRGGTAAEKFGRLRSFYSAVAGRDLGFNEDVYHSERQTGNRNRAIGHMLKAFGVLDGDPDEVLDLYFRQCSLEVTARDLAVMACTLANSGYNPATGRQVLPARLVRQVLSVMTTCGMYNAAGDWVSTVGLPAKSGVGGGILAVLPGQLGISVFSPRLDATGNSVRGVEACRRLSEDLGLHFLQVARGARSAVRSSYPLTSKPSAADRSPHAVEILNRKGHRARVFELQGDILFAGAESVLRAISDDWDDLDLVLLEVSRVDLVSPVARQLLMDLRGAAVSRGGECALIDTEGGFADRSQVAGDMALFTTFDAAARWAEDWIINHYDAAEPAGSRL